MIAAMVLFCKRKNHNNSEVLLWWEPPILQMHSPSESCSTSKGDSSCIQGVWWRQWKKTACLHPEQGYEVHWKIVRNVTNVEEWWCRRGPMWHLSCMVLWAVHWHNLNGVNIKWGLGLRHFAHNNPWGPNQTFLWSCMVHAFTTWSGLPILCIFRWRH